jgi:hypothetical protein
MESVLMGFLPRYRKKRKKWTAFSLIAVLIISLIGLAVIGALLQITVISGGAGRTASVNAVKYNRLQEAVEEGKAKLKEKMMALGADPAPRYNAVGPIDDLDDLLISFDLDGPDPGIVRRVEIPASELGRMGIFVPSGTTATLTVAIYDMGYDSSPENIQIDPSDADFSKIPPAISLDVSGASGAGTTDMDKSPTTEGGANDAGTYLIRATLALGDEEFIMESAIMQAKDKP